MKKKKIPRTGMPRVFLVNENARHNIEKNGSVAFLLCLCLTYLVSRQSKMENVSDLLIVVAQERLLTMLGNKI
ncbi:hypothetical protein CHS0354_024645, partial [Potamilus streckersoni]